MYSQFSHLSYSHYFLPQVDYTAFEIELKEILFDLKSEDKILFAKLANLFTKYVELFAKNGLRDNAQNILRYSQAILEMEQGIEQMEQAIDGGGAHESSLTLEKGQAITTLYHSFERDDFSINKPAFHNFLTSLYNQLIFLLNFQTNTYLFLAYPLVDDQPFVLGKANKLKLIFITNFEKNSLLMETLERTVIEKLRGIPYLQLSHFNSLRQLARCNIYFNRLNTAVTLYQTLPPYYSPHAAPLKEGIEQASLKLKALQTLDSSFAPLISLYETKLILLREKISVVKAPLFPSALFISDSSHIAHNLNPKPQQQLLSFAKNTLDAYGFFKSLNSNTPQIQSHHLAWFLNAAMLLEARFNTDRKTQKTLEFLTLHAYFNVSRISFFTEEFYGIQATFRGLPSYYRTSTSNAALDLLNMKISSRDICTDFSAIQNTLFEEVIKRLGKLSTLAEDILTIESVEKFTNFLMQFEKYDRKDSVFFINITPLLNKTKLENFSAVPGELYTQLLNYFTNETLEKIKEWAAYIRPIGIFSFQGLCFAYHPCLLNPMPSGWWSSHVQVIKFLIKNNNSPPSPEDSLRAWVESESIESYFKRERIPFPWLTTPRKSPVVCKNYFDFIKQPIVEKFKNLSELHHHQAIPYLKILPKAIWELFVGLQEFADIRQEKHTAIIDERFQEKNLTDLLQFFYYLILEAMNQAILYKDDFAIFQNCLIVISQQLLAILSITSPHEENALHQAVVTKFTQGPNPVINSNLSPALKAYGKLSSLHGLGCIRSGVELQKDAGDTLNILLDKRIYYEISEELAVSNQCSLDKITTLDSEQFLQDWDLARTLSSIPNEDNLIDLFLGHFQEPCSAEQRCYRPIPLLEQVKTLIQKGWTANYFTVAIDTTLSLERSVELREFFSDPLIEESVRKGKLNVCLVRSAQKCAMFGLDNFFAGLLVTVNKQDSFKAFNQRMAAPDDQLTGQAFQALTTIQKYSTMLDDYRQGLIDNTRKLYEALPKAMIYDPNHPNPIQVSQIEDKSCIFLDIKFVDSPETCKVFIAKLKNFAKKKNLIIDERMGFGFLYTTISLIEYSKVWRITPGLEKGEDIETLAYFFQICQKIIDQVWIPEQPNDGDLAEELKNFNDYISKIPVVGNQL